MGEKGLPISRSLNLTTNDGLWNFYHGVSLSELKDIKDENFKVVNKFFTTNFKKAQNYAFDGKTVINIKYQVAFNILEQMRVFNKLHSNRSDFFDILCDRDLPFEIKLNGYDFYVSDYNYNPIIIQENNYNMKTSLFSEINKILRSNEAKKM